ncbi:MAG: peptidase, partial [Chloroflexota bacterium]
MLGVAQSVPIATPGKIALLTFAGTTGQRISVLSSSWAMSQNVTITIKRPDGSTMYGPSNLGNGWYLDTMTLSATGTYTLVVDPISSGTGSQTIRIYDVPADFSGSITAGGAAVSVPISTPGQGASLTFAGTTGQRISVLSSSW